MSLCETLRLAFLSDFRRFAFVPLFPELLLYKHLSVSLLEIRLRST